mgnify:CR=1 FL=1
MYRIIIRFPDQSCIEFHGIDEIEYSVAGGQQMVSKEKILSHRFPLYGNYCFYGNDILASVKLDDARSLEISIEN